MMRSQEWIMARVYTEPNSGCWLWARRLLRNGYGQVKVNRGHLVMAHRLSFESFVGAIPPGMQVDHVCRNRACVNPDHLEPVAHLENMRRRDAYAVAAETCKHGHKLDGSRDAWRTAPGETGRRYCKTCNLMSKRRQRAKALLERAEAQP